VQTYRKYILFSKNQTLVTNIEKWMQNIDYVRCLDVDVDVDVVYGRRRMPLCPPPQNVNTSK